MALIAFPEVETKITHFSMPQEYGPLRPLCNSGHAGSTTLKMVSYKEENTPYVTCKKCLGRMSKWNKGITLSQYIRGVTGSFTKALSEKAKVSPSATYVAMCNTTNFDAYYFVKFTLPTLEEFIKQETTVIFRPISENEKEALAHNAKEKYRNDSEFATWYFLNRLDQAACTNDCFPFENYTDIAQG